MSGTESAERFVEVRVREEAKRGNEKHDNAHVRRSELRAPISERKKRNHRQCRTKPIGGGRHARHSSPSPCSTRKRRMLAPDAFQTAPGCFLAAQNTAPVLTGPALKLLVTRYGAYDGPHV